MKQGSVHGRRNSDATNDSSRSLQLDQEEKKQIEEEQQALKARPAPKIEHTTGGRPTMGRRKRRKPTRKKVGEISNFKKILEI